MANEWLRYANQGATRNQPLSPSLIEALGKVAPQLGLSVEVFSGGQDAAGPNRVGSHRHDHGNAADVFFMKDGRRLDWANPKDVPVFQDLVKQAKAAGITGIGAGPGYMREGSMHIGFGTPAVWGAGGKSANAPEWLRTAYSGTPAMQVDPTTGPMGQEPGSPAPPMAAPRDVATLPAMAAKDMPAKNAPPPSMLAMLSEDTGQKDAGSSILSMLSAQQPQEPPQLTPPQPANPQQGKALTDFISQYLQSRMV